MVWQPEHSIPYLRAYDGTAQAFGVNSSNNSVKTARQNTARATPAADTAGFDFIFFPFTRTKKLPANSLARISGRDFESGCDGTASGGGHAGNRRIGLPHPQ